MTLGRSRQLWELASDETTKTSAVLRRLDEIDSRARDALRSRLIVFGVFVAFSGVIIGIAFDPSKASFSNIHPLLTPQLILGLCFIGLVIVFVFAASSWQLLLSLNYVKLSPYYFSAAGNPILKTDEDWAEEFRPSLEKAEKWFGAGADGIGAIVGFLAWIVMLIMILIILIPAIASYN